MKINFKRLILALFTIIYSGVLVAQEKNAPNIIIILTDDQGYKDQHDFEKLGKLSEMKRESILAQRLSRRDDKRLTDVNIFNYIFYAIHNCSFSLLLLLDQEGRLEYVLSTHILPPLKK